MNGCITQKSCKKNSDLLWNFPQNAPQSSVKGGRAMNLVFFAYLFFLNFTEKKNSHPLGAQQGLNTVKTFQRRDLYLSLLFNPYTGKRFKISQFFIVFVTQSIRILRPWNLFSLECFRMKYSKKDSLDKSHALMMLHRIDFSHPRVGYHLI